MRRSLCLLSLVLALPLQAQEKVVNLYSWADYVAPQTLQRFERETGYKVRYDTFDTTEVLETKLLTGGSGYDVVVPSATVLARALKANALQPLDPQAMPGYSNLDKDLLAKLAEADPGNRHAVPYTWGTLGLGVNVEAVRQRLGDVPLDSLDLLFKPELAAKFADCGISIIDSPDEVLAVVLHYLGRDPHSGKAEDLDAALALLKGIKPHIRKFQSQPVTQLVNGDLCLSLGYSGDMTQARRAAAEAGKRSDFEYRLPKEGSTIWMDTMAIPVDAPHPDYAYAFINFVMRPANMAAITNSTGYPTASAKARSMVDAPMTANPDIYLDEASYGRLIPGQDLAQSQMRARMRAWTRFKSSF